MRSTTRRAPRLALSAALALTVAGGTALGDAPAFPEQSYRAHIERLSSDEFEGRGAGTAGERKTIAYLEQQFRAAGLAPGNGGSYLQAVPAAEIVTQADRTLEVRGRAGALSLAYGDDMVVWTRRPARAEQGGRA